METIVAASAVQAVVPLLTLFTPTGGSSDEGVSSPKYAQILPARFGGPTYRYSS